MKKEQGDRIFWIWLSRCLGEASRWYPSLLERFLTPYDIYKADEEELTSLMPEMSPRVRAALCDKRLDRAYEILEYCHRGGCELLCYDDAAYPLSLRCLEDPPLVLYYRGRLPDFRTRLHVAVVGTREMSEYGKQVAYKIGYELADAGAVVVSGMARGVDGVAAGAALAAGGTTVAVMGSGIDVVYPREHTEFKRVIERQGVVMTEYPPGARPEGFHFPVRNRLISGLSQATLVVEADEGSGALLTAKHALFQGRALYAVPANVGEKNAAGTNGLIRDGARVALSAEDILKDFSMLYRHSVRVTGTSALGAQSDFDARVLVGMGVYLPREDKASAFQASRRQTSAPRRSSQSDAPAKTEESAFALCEEGRVSPCRPDASAQVLTGLGERERTVFEAIPMDSPVALDQLRSLGLGTGELLAALSMLEIQGLIQTLPGGIYARA